jgi:hypothetical protein
VISLFEGGIRHRRGLRFHEARAIDYDADALCTVDLSRQDLLEFVIPECIYRKSRRDWNWTPIKTFGGDAFKTNLIVEF